MKRAILLITMIVIVAFMSNANNPAKEDTTKNSFSAEYQALKKEFIHELKKDSFLVSVPVISDNFFRGEIEVAPGVHKLFFTKTVIGTKSEWRYPEFDNGLFEEWVKKREERNKNEQKKLP